MSQENSPKPEEPIVASHEELFEPVEACVCDACGRALDAEEDEDTYGIPGAGTYLWTRGDRVQIETAPLCASCAAAIGVTALARWEIEEEEG